jgi:hypothetical protein
MAGARQWRRRDQVPDTTKASSGTQIWAGRLNDLGPRGAALVGVLKQPWAITIAAAAVVAHHHASRSVTLIAFTCFVVASSASVGLMYVYYARHPGEANAYLAELQGRVVALGPRAFALAAMAIGTVVAVDALAGLKGW